MLVSTSQLHVLDGVHIGATYKRSGTDHSIVFARWRQHASHLVSGSYDSQVCSTDGVLIGSAVFAPHTSVTNTQTRTQRQDMRIGIAASSWANKFTGNIRSTSTFSPVRPTSVNSLLHTDRKRPPLCTARSAGHSASHLSLVCTALPNQKMKLKFKESRRTE